MLFTITALLQEARARFEALEKPTADVLRRANEKPLSPIPSLTHHARPLNACILKGAERVRAVGIGVGFGRGKGCLRVSLVAVGVSGGRAVGRVPPSVRSLRSRAVPFFEKGSAGFCP